MITYINLLSNEKYVLGAIVCILYIWHSPMVIKAFKKDKSKSNITIGIFTVLLFAFYLSMAYTG